MYGVEELEKLMRNAPIDHEFIKAKQELTTKLREEMGEVLTVLGKCERFGTRDDYSGTVNVERLIEELVDLQYVTGMMLDLLYVGHEERAELTIKKMQKFSQFTQNKVLHERLKKRIKELSLVV